MTAEERARLTLERWWVADRSWDEMTRKVAAAITAAVEEREKELIGVFCSACRKKQDTPRRHDDVGRWWHEAVWRPFECPASPLHEAIHQHDRKLREGKG